MDDFMFCLQGFYVIFATGVKLGFKTTALKFRLELLGPMERSTDRKSDERYFFLIHKLESCAILKLT